MGAIEAILLIHSSLRKALVAPLGRQTPKPGADLSAAVDFDLRSANMERIIDSWCCNLAVNLISRSTGIGIFRGNWHLPLPVCEMSKYTASFRS